MSRRLSLTVLAILIVLSPSLTRSAAIGWPEAVTRLTAEREKAVRCAIALKQTAAESAIAEAQRVYDDARADYNALIAGLITALSEGETPKALPILEKSLEEGAAARAKFCQLAYDSLHNAPGEKGVLEALVKEAAKLLIEPIKEAVATLYHDIGEAMTRATIRTELEAAQWPPFADIKV